MCDPVVTYGPYLNAFELKELIIKRYINSSIYFTLLYKIPECVLKA